MGVLSRTPAPIDADRPAAADLLRVVAALAVATFHIWQQSWFSLGSDHWQRAGSIGVDLLVMLSAFCLFLPWANAAAQGRPLPLTRAAAFYNREGFTVTSEGIDADNGERELTMFWSADTTE